MLMCPKDEEGIGNGVDPDPTAPFPGSAFFALTFLSHFFECL